MTFEKEKAAHAAGKRIQYWSHSRERWEALLKPSWLTDVPYRIHPDDLPQPTEETMNKTEAIKQAAVLEQELTKLRQIIEAPEPAPSLLTKPEPGSRNPYWRLEGYGIAPLGTYKCMAANPTPDVYRQGNIFQSEDLAKAYAEAIDTMLLLRHQPGTVGDRGDIKVWGIDCLMSDKVIVEAWSDHNYRATSISPCFSSRDLAQTAIDTLGAERILRMFKTLHHAA